MIQALIQRCFLRGFASENYATYTQNREEQQQKLLQQQQQQQQTQKSLQKQLPLRTTTSLCTMMNTMLKFNSSGRGCEELHGSESPLESGLLSEDIGSFPICDQ